jgi:hypothetical protein
VDGDSAMMKDSALAYLEFLQLCEDKDWAHSEADTLLLAYIDDEDITMAFRTLVRRYA